MPYIFIRNYQDYLDKKISERSFCSNKLLCEKNTQGRYILFKIFKQKDKGFLVKNPEISSCHLLNKLYTTTNIE